MAGLNQLDGTSLFLVVWDGGCISSLTMRQLKVKSLLGYHSLFLYISSLQQEPDSRNQLLSCKDKSLHHSGGVPDTLQL
jgi:hypothetical protein